MWLRSIFVGVVVALVGLVVSLRSCHRDDLNVSPDAKRAIEKAKGR